MSDDKQPIPCSVVGCRRKNLAWYEIVYRPLPHMCEAHQSNARGLCAASISSHFGGRSSCSRKGIEQVSDFLYCKQHAKKVQR